MFQTTNQLENDSRTALADLHFEPAQPKIFKKMFQQMWALCIAEMIIILGAPSKL